MSFKIISIEKPIRSMKTQVKLSCILCMKEKLENLNTRIIVMEI